MDATILNNCILNNSHEYSDDPLQYILFDESVSSGVVWIDAYAATSGQTNLEIVEVKNSIWNPLKAHRILSPYQQTAKIIMRNFISTPFDSAARQPIPFMFIVKVKI